MDLSEHQEGYDVKLTTEIHEEWKCVVCHLVLRNPVQIMSCGHRYCACCFDRMKKYAEDKKIKLLCPIDNMVIPLDRVFPDIAHTRFMGSLQVVCENSERGCKWENQLRDLEKHQGSCEFKLTNSQLVLSVKILKRKLASKDVELESLKEDLKRSRAEVEALSDSNATLRNEIDGTKKRKLNVNGSTSDLQQGTVGNVPNRDNKLAVHTIIDGKISSTLRSVDRDTYDCKMDYNFRD